MLVRPRCWFLLDVCILCIGLSCGLSFVRPGSAKRAHCVIFIFSSVLGGEKEQNNCECSYCTVENQPIRDLNIYDVN